MFFTYTLQIPLYIVRKSSRYKQIHCVSSFMDVFHFLHEKWRETFRQLWRSRVLGSMNRVPCILAGYHVDTFRCSSHLVCSCDERSSQYITRRHDIVVESSLITYTDQRNPSPKTPLYILANKDVSTPNTTTLTVHLHLYSREPINTKPTACSSNTPINTPTSSLSPQHHSVISLPILRPIKPSPSHSITTLIPSPAPTL
jgi:hypothetical protein